MQQCHDHNQLNKSKRNQSQEIYKKLEEGLKSGQQVECEDSILITSNFFCPPNMSLISANSSKGANQIKIPTSKAVPVIIEEVEESKNQVGEEDQGNQTQQTSNFANK